MKNAAEANATRLAPCSFAIDRGAFRFASVGGLNAAVAHLVMARGTGRDNPTTQWSVHSIEQRAGISRPNADKAVKALLQRGIWKKIRYGQHPIYEAACGDQIPGPRQKNAPPQGRGKRQINRETQLSPRAENRNMAQIFCFPLHRREKLIRELRRARTHGEVRFALRRAALALERVGVPAAIIDAQIRQISLMTRRQMWRFQPAERPSGDAA
jgi:hypothetical protein